MIDFTISQTAALTRRGVLQTSHGQVATPAVFLWAINGSFSGLTAKDCYEIGIQGISLELLPLSVHPGSQVIRQAGGLNSFLSWDRPILSVPAAFPATSHLKSNVAELGVRYQEPYTNAYKRMTIEKAQELTAVAAADLQVPLFQSVDYYAPVDDLKKSVQVNLAWQKELHDSWKVLLGGGLHDLRAEMVNSGSYRAALIANLPDDDLTEYQRILTELVKMLPANCLRVAAARSTAELCLALEAGIDIVIWRHPLKDADRGIGYSEAGPLHLRQAQYETVNTTLISGYQPTFLHYLLHEKSPAANNILAKHNLASLVSLMHDWRKSIGNAEQSSQFEKLKKAIVSPL